MGRDSCLGTADKRARAQVSRVVQLCSVDLKPGSVGPEL